MDGLTALRRPGGCDVFYYESASFLSFYSRDHTGTNQLLSDGGPGYTADSKQETFKTFYCAARQTLFRSFAANFSKEGSSA